MTIVPEIEMPGHAQAAIASYPRLGTGGAPPPVSPDWGVHDYLFNPDETTLGFLEDVLAEVIELFPGEYIHVGGDEAVKNRWQDSPRVQARMRELGLADEIGAAGLVRGRASVASSTVTAGGSSAGTKSWRAESLPARASCPGAEPKAPSPPHGRATTS